MMHGQTQIKFSKFSLAVCGQGEQKWRVSILLNRQLLHLLPLKRQEVRCRAEESSLRHGGSERWCFVLRCVCTGAVVGNRDVEHKDK